jgi:hypothetical protein
MQRKFLTFAISTLWLFANVAQPAQAVAAGIDPTVAQQVALDVCKSPSQLDCIESLGILSTTGAYFPGKYTRYALQSDKKDKYGNRVRFGTALFDLRVGSKSQTVGMQVFLSTPSFRRDIGGPRIMSLGALDSFVNNPIDDSTTKFRYVVRTSWLRPQNIQMHAKDADYSVEQIEGGQRWTFSGIRTHNPIWNEKHSLMSNPPAKADQDYTDLSFTVSHFAGVKADSWFDPKCADSGYTVEASNSSYAGMPQWNYSTHSLDFNMGAPHLTTKGKLNYGYFKTWMSDAYIHCMWPASDLDRATQYLVTVVDSDGSTQTASVSSGNTKGVLRLSVLNFHYSTPTIKLKCLDATPAPSVTPSPTPTP